jgi:hypothetical protein
LSAGSAIGAAQLASIVASSSPITLSVLVAVTRAAAAAAKEGKAAARAARMDGYARNGRAWRRVVSGARNAAEAGGPLECDGLLPLAGSNEPPLAARRRSLAQTNKQTNKHTNDKETNTQANNQTNKRRIRTQPTNERTDMRARKRKTIPTRAKASLGRHCGPATPTRHAGHARAATCAARAALLGPLAAALRWAACGCGAPAGVVPPRAARGRARSSPAADNRRLCAVPPTPGTGQAWPSPAAKKRAALRMLSQQQCACRVCARARARACACARYNAFTIEHAPPRRLLQRPRAIAHLPR